MPGTQADLIDALSEPDVPLPAELVTRKEVWLALDPLLARLPERWQEIFLLSAIDRSPDDRTADLEGRSAEAVRAIVLGRAASSGATG